MKRVAEPKRLVLLIDDNEQFIESFQDITRNKFKLLSATSGEKALQMLRKSTPDVVLLDMRFAEKKYEGLSILKRIKQVDRDLPVIIITEYAEMENAAAALQMGAEDYIFKTPKIEVLAHAIELQIRVLPWRCFYREVEDQTYSQMLGTSPAMQKVREEITRCAKVDIPVLITGESGTGKELVAHAIHNQSQRSTQIMFKINCSTLAPHLFESEFFGHERGAFTGAERRKKGKFELANQGTLFLDEIADLPYESQAKILDTLEYKSYQRVGGEQILNADVRIIAATNKKLQNLVDEGKFREDLFYRINALKIEIPPLRERTEDIPVLIHHYLSLACKEIKKPVPQIQPKIMRYWQTYHWPGNVRELKNKMMQVALETEEHLVEHYQPGDHIQMSNFSDFYESLLKKPYHEAKVQLRDDYIRSALIRNNKNVSETAKEIGVNRTTVYRILKSLSNPQSPDTDNPSHI